MIATGVAGTIAVLSILAMTLNNRKEESDSTELVEIADEDLISEKDIVKIFDTLFLQMQSVVAQLSQQIQQIQMAGQRIPEPQLRMILKQEFERAVVAKQSAIFEENGVDEECLRDATWEFIELGNAPVKSAVERFQKLYENVTGERVVGKRPGGKELKKEDEGPTEILSAEKLMDVAEEYFDAISEAMKGVVKEFEGKDLKHPAVAQELQMKFASVANDAGENSLKKKNITLNSFRASIEAHSANPAVGRKLAMLQMKQQQDLVAMGISNM